MKALVLCAGKGTRLAPLTDTVPKVMLPLDGQPLLGHTLSWLAHHGVDDVAINLHHLPDSIRDYVGDGSQWGLSVCYSYEPKLLGTAGAVRPLRDWIGQEPFLVIYGDKFFQADLSALVHEHEAHDALLTLAVHRTDRPEGAGLVCVEGGGAVSRYEEKPAQAFSEWGNAGLYVCSPGVLEYIPDPPSDWGYDVLPLLAEQGAMRAARIYSLAMDIGTPERYEQAQAIASQSGATFIDRDGTINQRPAQGQYIYTRPKFHFLPGALEGLAYLAKNSPRKIVVVTNQPCIAKGMATRDQVDDLHTWMQHVISENGGWTDGVYVCPHAPWDGCDCRKPKPGLLIQAAKELGIDLSQSVVVGDTGFDLQAGWAAGVRECYQVLTGAKLEPFVSNGHEYEVYASLLDVARAIVRKEGEA